MDRHVALLLVDSRQWICKYDGPRRLGMLPRMSVYAVKRKTAKGDRWYVRADITIKTPTDTVGVVDAQRITIHLDTCDTEARAEARKKIARDELADGKVPTRGPRLKASTQSLRKWGEAWIATRHDLADVTRKPYERMIRTWPADLAALDPQVISHTDVQEWVTEMSRREKRNGVKGGLARGSIARELGVLKLVLDYAGRSANNPARDRNVKLPRRKRKQHRLPNRAQILELHAWLPTRIPLMNLLEHTGLRIQEAGNLRWRDVDHARARLLVTKSKTDAGIRFVTQLPGAPQFPVMPDGANPASLVFPKAGSFTNVLRETHERRGTFLMGSHDWRHLHASRLLHEQILSPAQIAARLGHSTPAILLTTYAHVVPPDD